MATFCERQRGDMCRMHALNNYLGAQVYTEAMFAELCREYDQKCPGQPSCTSYDSVQGTQEPLFAYVLRTRHGWPGYMCCPSGAGGLVYTMGSISLEEALQRSHMHRVFVFDTNHVWTLHMPEIGHYFNVDSISGVREIQLHELSGRNDLYYYIVLAQDAITAECKRLSEAMITLTAGDVHQYLVQTNGALRNLEPLMCHFFCFLSVLKPGHVLCLQFENFYKNFQAHPADIVNIVANVPGLVFDSVHCV